MVASATGNNFPACFLQTEYITDLMRELAPVSAGKAAARLGAVATAMYASLKVY